MVLECGNWLEWASRMRSENIDGMWLMKSTLIQLMAWWCPVWCPGPLNTKVHGHNELRGREILLQYGVRQQAITPGPLNTKVHGHNELRGREILLQYGVRQQAITPGPLNTKVHGHNELRGREILISSHIYLVYSLPHPSIQVQVEELNFSWYHFVIHHYQWFDLMAHQ